MDLLEAFQTPIWHFPDVSEEEKETFLLHLEVLSFSAGEVSPTFSVYYLMVKM